MDDVVTTLASDEVAVIHDLPDGSCERHVYRSMADYRYHLKLMRETCDGTRKPRRNFGH